MSEMPMTSLLADGLLNGSTVLLAGADQPTSQRLGDAVKRLCQALGADVRSVRADGVAEEQLDEWIGAIVAERRRIDVLVVDGSSLYAGEFSSHGALRACMDAAWNVTRSAINHAFLDARRGRIIYLSPPEDLPGARLACASLENLARTLSVEWARHAITTVAIASDCGDSADEVAAVVAYLTSPAGAYFSGCLLQMTGGSISRSSRRTDRP